MAKLGYTGTMNEYAPRDFEPIPAGKYAAIVTQSEVGNTKTGGQFVKLQWQIVEGPCTGRVIFSQHNIFNANADAERIGRSELQGFADAVGIGELEDSEQLHGKPLIAHVSLEKDKTGHYPDKNDIKRASRYGSAGGAQPAPKSYSPQQATNARSAQTSPSSTSRQGAPYQDQGARSASASNVAHQARNGGSQASMGGTRSNPFAE